MLDHNPLVTADSRVVSKQHVASNLNLQCDVDQFQGGDGGNKIESGAASHMRKKETPTEGSSPSP